MLEYPARQGDERNALATQAGRRRKDYQTMRLLRSKYSKHERVWRAA